jgi:geranylgeranyl pyrophosphate synthase
MRDYCRVTAADAGFDLAEFDRRLLESALGNSPPPLAERLGDLVRAGGKRIRPLLVYRFGSLCGGAPETLTHLALAVEMLHSGTLVHDDLIDQAETRRGRPAVQRQHGPETALLVGDLYVARCGVHLARVGVPRAAAEVWGALDTIVRGEISQRDHRFDLSQTADDYMLAIERKTASLLEATCAAAVEVCGGEETLVARARDYAGNLGRAFQVVDDVLDYAGVPDELGKPVGNDIREGTVTLPLILAMELSTAPVAAMLESARERDDYGAVVQCVRRSGAIERCLEVADAHSRQAVAALDVFPEVAEREALAELALSLPRRRA